MLISFGGIGKFKPYPAKMAKCQFRERTVFLFGQEILFLSEMEEGDLIKQVQQGDRKAFAILYEKYWQQVYNFCNLYLTGRSVAEEVVQEVFIKVWESRDFIRENDNIRGFLFIITRNLIFNQHRKSVNEYFYKMTLLSAMENGYDMEEEIEARNLSEYIDQLIAELPPRRKEIFNLSRKEFKSYKEIAELLQISEKTVENQIGEALKYLKRNILLLTFFV